MAFQTLLLCSTQLPATTVNRLR